MTKMTTQSPLARALGGQYLKLWTIVSMMFINACATTSNSVPMASPDSTPVLAYYYIWFDVGSWNRAKADYPLLGN